MAILYFLTSVIKGHPKRGKDAPVVDEFIRKVAGETEFCTTFPWGRYTFLDNLKEIKKLLRKMNGKVDKTNVNCPGFILSLELLAFEAIPALMTKCREKEEVERLGCPRMCKSKFQPCSLKGWPVSDLHLEIGETKNIHSILRPTEDEKELLSGLFDPEEEDDLIDDVVDSWTKRLEEGREVWFRDLCRDDIEGRKEEPKPVKPALQSSTPNETVNETTKASGSGERSISSVCAELTELREIWADGLIGLNKKLDGIVAKVDDMDSRLVQAERMIVQLSARTVDPPPSHMDATSEAEVERNEKKRKRAETKEKINNDVIEDVTPEDDGETFPKEHAPGKKKKTKRLSRV